MEQEVQAWVAEVRPADPAAALRARQRLESLTKPAQSLGLLEEIVVRLAGATGLVVPAASPAAVVVMAADHGIADAGVSAYAQEVTGQMALNIGMGGAAVNALAEHAGAEVVCVDVGVCSEVLHPRVLRRRVRPGTGDISSGPAMRREEAIAACRVGVELAGELAGRGIRLIAAGELGIGNTTAAAAVLAALTGLPAADVVGRGTGIHAQALRHKLSLVEAALSRSRSRADDPLGVLAEVGGLDIAGLVGLMLGCASRRVPVVLDGFITGAAALVAATICPAVTDHLLASHCSPEPGHREALRRLGLTPLLDWQLRLGEGSGAALVLPLVQGACRVMAQTATFADAGVNPARTPAAETPEAPREPVERPLPGGRRPVPKDFTEAETAAVYRAIAKRRDIRAFLPDPLPNDVLGRLLEAAHQGPSVGFMQPWSFILIRAAKTKQALHRVVDRERRAAALHFTGERQNHYLHLKLEGLLQAPLTVCVTCDPTRGGRHVIGRNSIAETDLLSTACAIENLWLAARAEGVAMGWVTIFQQADIQEILGIPPHVQPLGLLCLGYTAHFPERPLLQRTGWRQRLPIEELVFGERWGGHFQGGVGASR